MERAELLMNRTASKRVLDLFSRLLFSKVRQCVTHCKARCVDCYYSVVAGPSLRLPEDCLSSAVPSKRR